MFNKIFDDAKDKNVARVVLYAAADDGYLFSTKAHTIGTEVSAEEVKDAFLKGCVVEFNSALYIPVEYVEGENADDTIYGSVVVKSDAASYVFFSAEYVAPEEDGNGGLGA